MKNYLFVVCVRKIEIIIFFLVFIALYSCEKEGANSDPCQDIFKIRLVKVDSLTVEEMNYTGECLIYEYLQEFSYKKYSYDKQGHLTKIEQARTLDPTVCFMPVGSSDEIFADPRKAKITQYYSFEYDIEGKLTKKQNFFLNGEQFQLVSYNTYDYENGLVKQLNLYTHQGELSQKNIYTYDENGNIIRDEYYFKETGASFVLMNTHEYAFDDKANPYRIFKNEGIPGIFSNPNNIIRSTYSDNYSGDGYTHTEEYSYEYNTSGLPVKLNNFTYLYGE
jgi:hypothetical protein